MADTVDKDTRSRLMARVRNKNTKPEMSVRRLVFSMGYRYRLHGAKLPGRPDLVFASRRKVIFVHGCFWHRHEACKLARMPKSRLDFWGPKLEGNRQRDDLKLRALAEAGWSALVIWECETPNEAVLRDKIVRFLDG